MADAIALFSSSRRHGNTGQLLARVVAALDVEVVDLSALRLSPFDYEHRNRDDDFEPLMQRVLRHERIIFATPVYWYAVSAGMKVFLDRISDYLDIPELLEDGRRLRGKTGYVVCTSISAEPSGAFVQAFRDTFEYLGMREGGVLHVNCEDGFDARVHRREITDFAARLRAPDTAGARQR